ncbi:MAG: hypothetical protein ABI857_05690 [Acidobacteriota bacterium]
MKIRLTSTVLAMAIFSVIGQAALKEVPIRGNGSGNITGVTAGPAGVAITAIGNGVATHLGRFNREEAILLNPENFTFTGSIVFTAADGSELHCDIAGAFTGPATAAGTYVFTGGTGRFENASGNAYFSIVQSDPANFTFEFSGTIDMN